MYDKTKMIFKDNLTVNELCNILSTLPARAELCICGDSNCYIHVEQDGSVVNIDNESLDECYETELPRNSFEYGGYHFVPVRKFNKTENSNIRTITKNLATDVNLGFFRVNDIFGREQKYPYSYEKFYEASGNSKADIFRCIENNKLYVPGENELFIYIEKEKNTLA